MAKFHKYALKTCVVLHGGVKNFFWRKIMENSRIEKKKRGREAMSGNISTAFMVMPNLGKAAGEESVLQSLELHAVLFRGRPFAHSHSILKAVRSLNYVLCTTM
jgi:hypothetical protein